MSCDPEDHEAVKAMHKARAAEEETKLRTKYSDIGPFLEAYDDFVAILVEEGESDRATIADLRAELARLREGVSEEDRGLIETLRRESAWHWERTAASRIEALSAALEEARQDARESAANTEHALRQAAMEKEVREKAEANAAMLREALESARDKIEHDNMKGCCCPRCDAAAIIGAALSFQGEWPKEIVEAAWALQRIALSGRMAPHFGEIYMALPRTLRAAAEKLVTGS